MAKNAKKAVPLIVLFGMMLSVLCNSRAYAQLAGANLSGVVRDPSGAVVPKASVAIENTGTTQTRNVTSNGDGLYSASNLPPGNYDISVTAAGFNTIRQNGLVLTVGAQVAQDFTLTIGQTAQTVSVTAATTTIDTTSSTIGATVGATKIVELPLNGRDWTQLATLEAGVTSVRTQTTANQNANRGNRGFGDQLTDDGHRPNENTYRIDGININDYSNGSPGSVLGESLGVDAIQEFNVVTTNYTAAYGRTSGAVINAVTRPGTNAYHGTAFFFDRDRAWDARNYFDPSTIPPFLRKQFGASGGGPIIKDKFFIFSNYEGVRQSQSQTFSDVIPSASARAGILCSTPIASGPNACSTTTVTVSPLTAPYLRLWPNPTTVKTTALGGPSDNGDSVVWNTNALKLSTENFWTVRGDYTFSGKDTLSATYFLDFAPETIPDAVADSLVQVLTHRQMGGLTETHIFGSSGVNTARLGYNRVLGLVDEPYQALVAAAKDPTLALPGLGSGLYSPEISITGITQTGGLGWNTEDNHRYQSFQAYDDLSWVRGHHSLQAGVAFERMLYDMQFGTLNGSASFALNLPVPGSAMKNFLTDYVNSVSGTPTSFTGTPEYVRDSLFGIYAQDTWRLRSDLTLNVGLRYEFLTQPIEANNRWGLITDLVTPVTPVANCGNIYPAPFTQTNVPGCVEPVHQLWNHNPTVHNFDPRVGFSWDPFHDGKTAVRAGFGLFDILPLPYVYTYPLSETAPFIEGYSLSSAHQTIGQNEFPNFIPFAPAIFPSGHTLDPNPKRSYAMNWNLNIERTFSNNLIMTIGYVGSHSLHDFFTADGGDEVLAHLVNGVWTWPSPVGSGTLVDQNVSSYRPILFDTAAKYDGFEAKLDLKSTHRVSGEFNYTWSRCFDDGDSSSLGDPFSNSIATLVYYDKAMRHGPCDFDLTQSLTTNYLYELPGIKGDSLLTWAANGWQWGGIVTASSGVPFTLLTGGDPLGQKASATDFPNIVPGCAPINPNFKHRGNVYLNQSCFVVAPLSPAGPIVGDLGRNRLYGPSLVEWDTSIIKNMPVPRISEAFNVQFRFEFFNVLNHSNFSPPVDNNTLGSSLGLLDSTTTTSRQIQLGSKIVW